MTTRQAAAQLFAPLPELRRTRAHRSVIEHTLCSQNERKVSCDGNARCRARADMPHYGAPGTFLKKTCRLVRAPLLARCASVHARTYPVVPDDTLALHSAYRCKARSRSRPIPVDHARVKRALTSLTGFSSTPSAERHLNASTPNGPK